jgi:hypothetical protein
MEITRLLEILKHISDKKEYGELLIKYECGKVVLCKKTESIKV